VVPGTVAVPVFQTATAPSKSAIPTGSSAPSSTSTSNSVQPAGYSPGSTSKASSYPLTR
jgi:hypothetical protein